MSRDFFSHADFRFEIIEKYLLRTIKNALALRNVGNNIQKEEKNQDSNRICLQHFLNKTFFRLERSEVQPITSPRTLSPASSIS